jgi:hypothetical protein
MVPGRYSDEEGDFLGVDYLAESEHKPEVIVECVYSREGGDLHGDHGLGDLASQGGRRVRSKPRNDQQVSDISSIRYRDLLEHRVFHEVLRALLILAKRNIRLPESDCVPARIAMDPKMMPYFKDVVGAIDGSYFKLRVKASEQTAWRDRKQGLSTNVLIACDFDMRFRYILPGWEGSANDGKVFSHALENGIDIPKGTYWLADAGYSDTRRLLTLYRGIRYHLKESARAGLRPATYQELYNLRHAQLRTTVERVICRFKATFKALTVGTYLRIDVLCLSESSMHALQCIIG